MFLSQAVFILVAAMALYGLIVFIMDFITWCKEFSPDRFGRSSVTLLLPISNAEHTIEFLLRRVADTVCNQYADKIDRLIVLDGGSYDQTCNIVQKLERKYSFVRLLRQSEDIEQLLKTDTTQQQCHLFLLIDATTPGTVLEKLEFLMEQHSLFSSNQTKTKFNDLY